MKKYIVFLLGMLAHFLVLGQDVIKIVVMDHVGGLPYVEVLVKSKLHQLTDERGVLEVPVSLLSVGDTIWLNCLGFQRKCEVVDESFLNKKICDIFLVERTYDMDEVKVCAGLDAERFFEKKKRNMLLPYTDNHRVDAEVEYRLLDNKEIKVELKTPVVLDLVNKKFQLIRMAEPVDTTGLSFPWVIGQVAYFAYFKPNDYCRPKWRKCFDVSYKGLREGLWVWEFRLQPDKVATFGFAEKDRLVAFVYLDKDGLISKIESNIVIKSEKSSSYRMTTEYGLYKKQLVPVSSFIHVLLSSRKQGANVEEVFVRFSNYRKQ